MIDATGLVQSLTSVDLTCGLDRGQAIDHIRANRQLKRIGINNELILAAIWADNHPPESIDPHQLDLPGGDRSIQPGGDGTPSLARFCVSEFAADSHYPIGTAEHLIADALDLRHRLPLLDERMRAYDIDARDCQTIARQTRHLTLAQAMAVDAEIAASVGTVSFYRLMQLLEAAIIRADPERVRKMADKVAKTLGAWLGESNEHGIKALYMRLKAADGLWFYASLEQMVGVLKRRGHTGGKGELFSAALRVLGIPLLAVQYLAEDTEPTLFDHNTTDYPGPVNDGPLLARPGGPDFDDAAEPTDPGNHPDDMPLPDPVDEEEFPPEPATSDNPGSFRIEQDRRLAEQAIRAISAIDPAKLLPDATLYVHIALETLRDTLGVTRVEDLGPIVSSLVADWLGDCHVTLKPVIDLNADLMPVDAYETPPAMRERMFLKHPASMFPFSGITGRDRLDLDHNIPYVQGIDGQTREDKLAPLGRREHNVITHGPGWSRRRPSPGTILFRAPHGSIFLVNQTGSHDLGRDDFAQHIWSAAAPKTQPHAA